MPGRVLIAVRNPAVSGLLGENLTMFGYQPQCVSTVRQARKAIQAQRFDVALCDAALPERDSVALLCALQTQRIPVIFVSETEKALALPDGFQAVSNQDVIRPANIRELMARIDALLHGGDPSAPTFSYRDITVYEDSATVIQNGTAVALKPMEYALLLTFLRQMGQTLTREELLHQVWGDASVVATRTVDVHVAALRRKLGLAKALVTVYRTGYRLEKEAHFC